MGMTVRNKCRVSIRVVKASAKSVCIILYSIGKCKCKVRLCVRSTASFPAWLMMHSKFRLRLHAVVLGIGVPRI